MDLFYKIDITLFRLFNGELHNSAFDFIMPILTDLNKQGVVIALVLALLIWMIARGSKQVKIAALLLIITIIISDQLSSSLLKHIFDRPRPCRALENVRLLVSCGSGYSFPSSHAVNNFAGAVILAFFFKRAKWWFIGFASAVAYSRVYVGVHYPFDVLCGAIIGALIALCVIVVYMGILSLTKKSKSSAEK